MTLADDIISCRVPDLDGYLSRGELLDDIDEYGFTPLIEAVIARQHATAKLLLAKGVDVNKPDVTTRTALHWSVDNDDLEMTKFLLSNGADPNAYTNTGLSVLVYPMLRGQNSLKHLLYQHHAKLDFAMDFILAKLLGHRFELKGDTDILNAKHEFVEVDYEGFILEFTVAIIKDSLCRFVSSYSTRYLREYFPYVHMIIDAFMVADDLLRYQRHPILNEIDYARLGELIKTPLLILPVASRGHALSFIRYHNLWVKIDRGENSQREGCVNVYQITRPEALTVAFLENSLFKRQPREYFHQQINKKLGLKPLAQVPLSAQIVGNCSWANIQGVVAAAVAVIKLADTGEFAAQEVHYLYDEWIEWDKDRALDECIQRYYLASGARKASLVGMLAAVLFQSCDNQNSLHMARAEKILPILTATDNYYLLKNYLDVYCVAKLTRRGNNLLKILEDYGFNPNIGITPIATGLLPREDDI